MNNPPTACIPRISRILRRAVPADTIFPGVLPALSRIYAARHLVSPTELDCSFERLQPPGLLHGLNAAVVLLAEALEQRRRLLVVADFDADGATSCAVAVRALRALGAADVRYVVPNRFQYGYGLTPEIVAVAATQQPDVLITVDNGISSVEGVAAARQRGMAVLITDHHLPGAVLPAADAIVNPNQPGDVFPSKHLAGVGVIFYVMLALRTHLRDRGWFARQGIPEPNLAKLLDLVALGTVADVVAFDHNNRILVAQGLARINRGRGCPGIQALLQVAGRPLPLTAGDLGFGVAPRLNAAGRLQDMSLGIACLLTDDAAQALRLAQELDALNRERRQIEQEMQQQALAALEHMRLETADLPMGVCLYQKDWHQGVIGVLAGRLKDQLHRPVIAFAPGDDEVLKGSARSVPGVHIRDVLDAIAARHPGLLHKFGGHAMAAGLTLKRAQLEAFRAAFAEEVGRYLGAAELQGCVWSDGVLQPQELDLTFADAVRNGGPWGQGFPEPVFDDEFDIMDCRVVGERHLKLAVRQINGGKNLDAVAFNSTVSEDSLRGRRLQIAYKLGVNTYQGYRSLQLVVEHLQT